MEKPIGLSQHINILIQESHLKAWRHIGQCPVSEYHSKPYNTLITLIKYYWESRKLVQLVKRLKHLTLFLEICVKFCVKNPSLAHRAGVKVEVKGQIGADHLNLSNFGSLQKLAKSKVCTCKLGWAKKNSWSKVGHQVHVGSVAVALVK